MTVGAPTEQSSGPRGLAGSSAMTAVGFAFVVTMLGTTLPTPLYPAYAALFGFGELVTTVVFATYAVGVTAGLLLFGHWSDELGRRPMLLAGLALSAVSALSFLLAGPLVLLFLGRFLSGLSAGIVTGTATATIIDVAPARLRNRAGLVGAAVNMGGLGLGPVLAGVLAQYAPHPRRLVFGVDIALVVMAAAAVAALADPVRRAARPRLAPRRLSVPPELRALFVRAAVAGFAGFAVLGLFTSVSPAFLGKVLHHSSEALVGIVVFAVFAASVLGQTASERVGVDNALVAGCAGLVVAMVVLGLALIVQSLPLLIVAGVMAGLGQGLSFRAGSGAVAAGSPDEMRGRVTSTLFVALYVGISMPVIGVGALSLAVGLVTAGVSFAVLVAVLAATAMVLVRRSVRAKDAGFAATDAVGSQCAAARRIR